MFYQIGACLFSPAKKRAHVKKKLTILFLPRTLGLLTVRTVPNGTPSSSDLAMLPQSL